ncbi:MAG: type I-F CRISPR-associated endoribonuclease Cas6/Csy4 [Chlorobium sp.]|nr:MAG: type I-F CRISPR-associated endoribonuclease Cas6/Csy4 [Chlorobium sp.]
MNHYLEIQILPDPEFIPSIIMNVLYSKLHSALVKTGRSDIGLSFPDFNLKRKQLGMRLRLHGTEEGLMCLMPNVPLTGLRDHLWIGNIQEVPAGTSYIKVQRVQCKSNAERMRRRLIKRKKITEEEALAIIPDSVQKHLNLPYLTLKSVSTGQSFQLFIRQEVTINQVPGIFNLYALSNQATVPMF